MHEAMGKVSEFVGRMQIQKICSYLMAVLLAITAERSLADLSDWDTAFRYVVVNESLVMVAAGVISALCFRGKQTLSDFIRMTAFSFFLQALFVAVKVMDMGEAVRILSVIGFPLLISWMVSVLLFRGANALTFSTEIKIRKMQLWPLIRQDLHRWGWSVPVSGLGLLLILSESIRNVSDIDHTTGDLFRDGMLWVYGTSALISLAFSRKEMNPGEHVFYSLLPVRRSTYRRLSLASSVACMSLVLVFAGGGLIYVIFNITADRPSLFTLCLPQVMKALSLLWVTGVFSQTLMHMLGLITGRSLGQFIMAAGVFLMPPQLGYALIILADRMTRGLRLDLLAGDWNVWFPVSFAFRYEWMASWQVRAWMVSMLICALIFATVYLTERTKSTDTAGKWYARQRGSSWLSLVCGLVVACITSVPFTNLETDVVLIAVPVFTAAWSMVFFRWMKEKTQVKSLVYAGVAGAAVFLALFSLKSDITGYVRFVPESEDVARIIAGENTADILRNVEAVSQMDKQAFSGMPWIDTEKPEQMIKLQDFHRQITENPAPVPQPGLVSFSIVYIMKDSTTHVREYNLRPEEAGLAYQPVRELYQSMLYQKETP